MNVSGINRNGINGANLPNWVVRAVVLAVAAATVSAAPTRTTFATAVGDASVSVSVSGFQEIAGRAENTASASASAEPSVIRSGAVDAIATATGNASVIRYVQAEAAGDAYATGEALAAQALGSAEANAQAVAIACDAHIVYFGYSLDTCTADYGTASGDVTRYGVVQNALGSIEYTRAEGSIRLSGQLAYLHNGYVIDAYGLASSTVDADKTLVSVTLGSFDFANAEASAAASIRYSSGCDTLGSSECVSAEATIIKAASASGDAVADGIADAVRTANGEVLDEGTATAYPVRGLVNYSGSAAGDAVAEVVLIDPLRTTYGTATGNASAELVSATQGAQWFATAQTDATATGEASALQAHSGAVSAACVGTLQATPQRTCFATVYGQAVCNQGVLYGFSNSDIRAPDERYMIVPAVSRVMIVGAEYRTMRVSA